jgi:predicted metalloprotease with PDZ domain
MGGNGLEHQRSSENGVGTDYFTGWNEKAGFSDLLAHEFTHSWNGKYRRGADLWTPNFNVPMQDSLLWVYEGQTQFWGNVLAARSGMRPLRGLARCAGAGRGDLCGQPRRACSGAASRTPPTTRSWSAARRVPT